MIEGRNFKGGQLAQAQVSLNDFRLLAIFGLVEDGWRDERVDFSGLVSTLGILLQLKRVVVNTGVAEHHNGAFRIVLRIRLVRGREHYFVLAGLQEGGREVKGDGGRGIAGREYAAQIPRVVIQRGVLVEPSVAPIDAGIEHRDTRAVRKQRGGESVDTTRRAGEGELDRERMRSMPRLAIG